MLALNTGAESDSPTPAVAGRSDDAAPQPRGRVGSAIVRRMPSMPSPKPSSPPPNPRVPNDDDIADDEKDIEDEYTGRKGSHQSGARRGALATSQDAEAAGADFSVSLDTYEGVSGARRAATISETAPSIGRNRNRSEASVDAGANSVGRVTKGDTKGVSIRSDANAVGLWRNRSSTNTDVRSVTSAAFSEEEHAESNAWKVSPRPSLSSSNLPPPRASACLVTLATPKAEQRARADPKNPPPC